MAISDYLMTRLGLAQQARAVAAETEQMRAARQAAQNRQNVAYLDALLQTGMKVPGMIGDIGAAQGAAGIEEATTGLSAGEMAGPSEFTRSADIVRPAGVGVASTLTAPTDLSEADKVKIRSSGLAGVDMSKIGTEEMVPTETEVAPSTPAGLSEADKAKIRSTGIAGVDMSKIGTEEPGIEPADTYSIDNVIQQRLEAAKSSAAARAASNIVPQTVPGGPLITEKELAGAFATPSTAQPTIVPTGLRPTEQAGEAVETITVPGNIQIPRPSARTTPETAAAEVLPSVQEEIGPVKKEVEEIAKLEDPFAKAQGEFIKKLNSYQPPKYKVNVQDAADKIVEDTWKNKQPNAILNFLSFGQYNNNLENAKRLAKKMVASEITGLRKQETEGLRKQFIETAKLEAQQIAMLQKDINEKRKMEFKGSLKTLNPEKAIAKLQDYNEVDRAIGMYEEAARNLIASGAKFPGGAKYNKVMADLKAFTAKPDRSKGAALNASLVAAGAGGSVNLGGESVNIDALQDAIQSLQNAEMADSAKEFLTQQMLLAQTIGKAKEGGRMTDADLRFYLDNLFVSNANKPSTLLRSVNRLKKVNANSQNDWLSIYNSLYPEQQLPFSALAGTGFTDEELQAADAVGFYDTLEAARAATARARGRESLSDAAAQGVKATAEAVRTGYTTLKALAEDAITDAP